MDEAKSKALFQKAEYLRQRSKQQDDSPKNYLNRAPSRREKWKTRTKTKKRIKSHTVGANEGTQCDKAQREFQNCQAIEADEEVRTRKNVALVISRDENEPNVGGVSDQISVNRTSNFSNEPDAIHREDDKTPNASTSNISKESDVTQREDDSISREPYVTQREYDSFSKEPDAVQREYDETPNASGARRDVAKVELASVAKGRGQKRKGKKRKKSDQLIKSKNEWKIKAFCEVQIPLSEILMARKKYLQTLNPNQNNEGQQPIDREQDEIKVLPIQLDKIELIEISDDENEEAPVEFSARGWSSTLCQQCGTYVRCNI